MTKLNKFSVAKAAALLLGLGSLASATTFTFDTDAFAGTPVRTIPGRQIVGGELFIGFNTAVARMLNLKRQAGVDAMLTFSAANFAITGSQTVPEPSGRALMCVGIALLCLPVVRRLANRRTAGAAAVLLFAAGAQAADVGYTNIIDTTGGFNSFGFMPAISNSGAVAFNAVGAGYESGAVFRWQDGRLTVIASKEVGGLTGFGEAIAVNSAGVVGFGSKVLSDNDTIIGRGDGGPVTVIASAARHGLVGGGFLGLGGMNESGHIVFLAIRKFFRSQAIFEGEGGPLTPMVDTLTSPNFVAFGNAAIDAAGRVVFGAFTDTAVGIFTLSPSALNTVVTTDSGFNAFLDPVINNAGTVASAAFPNVGGPEVFTAKRDVLTAATNPASTLFSLVDNVSINNSGDVAFFANETSGRDGIFIRGKEDGAPVALIETGDALFGSQVTHLSVGRFSLNDRGQVVFLYGLRDGRSGLAIVSRQPGRGR